MGDNETQVYKFTVPDPGIGILNLYCPPDGAKEPKEFRPGEYVVVKVETLVDHG